ncbi:hypothetical protein FSP39_025452 [Pinctada imbricata]|uniref:Uncharacterized protein n=1 Tax=Pinctada imbricata TaxID=66713 RepID=A0AA88YL63_PINIB|nr:hypothetical protein FSP39_025452 [Pinctada imbricata]
MSVLYNLTLRHVRTENYSVLRLSQCGPVNMINSSSSSSETDISLSSTRSKSRHFPKQTFNVGRHGRKCPNQASDWTLDHLCKIGIEFDDHSMDLDKFMTTLKTREIVVCNELDKIPQIGHSLLELTNKMWHFSYAFDKEKGNGILGAKQKTEEAIEEFEDIEDEMEKIFCSDSSRRKLYFSWRKNLLDFWWYYHTLLTRWSKPLQTEGKYNQLFTAFSKIFRLYPEVGGAYSESIIIGDMNVTGIPDIRFLTFADKVLKLMIVTKVKQYDAIRGEYNPDTFTYHNVSRKVLGQHGIELLLEARDSYFFPYVVGVLCIGTKIIFTSMYIEMDIYNEIVEEGTVQPPNKVNISYTRPYDYMDYSDRQALMEPMFWFGFVQSNAYKYKAM